MPKDFAVVVLGGGPAGAVCARRLADRGLRTLLVDKAEFPREKVCGCCLNLSALQALDQVGLGHLAAELGAVELRHWHVGCGKTTIRCALPGGFALSRSSLDNALIQQAAAAGAAIRTGTIAAIEALTDERVTVRLQSVHPGRPAPAVETITASVAVVATGLSGGGLERWLPYQKRPSGPFGVGLNVKTDEQHFPAGSVFMACGAEGYVGVVRLEDGSLDVAAALMPPGSRRRNARPVPRWASGEASADRLAESTFRSADAAPRASLAARITAILEQGGLPSPLGGELGRIRTTPQLRRSRKVGNGRLIAIGDAAQYVEPFTGEGMAWAMNSGLIAANVVLERIASHPELLGDQWLQTCQKLLRRRQWPCRLITTALQSDLGRRSLFGSLNRMPWLAKPVIHYLNQAHVA